MMHNTWQLKLFGNVDNQPPLPALNLRVAKHEAGHFAASLLDTLNIFSTLDLDLWDKRSGPLWLNVPLNELYWWL